MPEISFRRANAADIADLAALRQQQLQEEGAAADTDISQMLMNYFEENLSNGKYLSWLAVNREGGIIATSGISFYRLPPTYGNVTGYVGQIASMYTLKPYRRGRIAAKLLSKIVDEAVKRECFVIRVTASEQGKFLYKDFGFFERHNFLEYSAEKKRD